MGYEASGKIVSISDTEKKSDSFKSREFVIEVPGQYPQLVKFQAVQDRCDVLDRFNNGDEVKVYFDLRGREWQGKYFTTLQAWRIESTQEAATQGEPIKGTEDLPF
jgi:single-strand DNA-binding protein